MLLPRYFYEGIFSPFEPLIIRESRECLHYETGSYLQKYGGYLDSLFYIVDGMIRHTSCTENGQETLVSFFGPGSLFPVKCHAFHFTLEPFLAVQAVVDVTAYRLPPDRFMKLVRENPDLAVAAIDFQTLYSNLNAARQFVKNYSSVESQVCSFLFIYYHCCPDGNGLIRLTQDAVASATATSRVQVARIYQMLRTEGIIRTGKNAVYITDIDRLRNHCSGLVCMNDESS